MSVKKHDYELDDSYQTYLAYYLFDRLEETGLSVKDVVSPGLIHHWIEEFEKEQV